MSFYFDMANRTGVDQFYSQFMSDVLADAGALAVCDFEHQTFVRHLERWNQHHDDKGPSEDACRKSHNNVIAAAESGELVASAREPVVTAFFELHERRASERLLELE